MDSNFELFTNTVLWIEENFMDAVSILLTYYWIGYYINIGIPEQVVHVVKVYINN